MHMSDALVSPIVGATAWAGAALLIGYSARKIHIEADERKVPLMGVAAAFVFASQMLNFAIPGTGSSGHLGGGLILAILLGPHAAFLAMASVLTVQALFFADGGLLALGCNILNLGLFTCFIAYPLFFKPIAGKTPSPLRLTIAAILASVVGLQIGAFAVVLETTASGISELPFATFALLMQPIPLAIGIVEGIATATVALFLLKTRPDMILSRSTPAEKKSSLRPLLIPLAAAILLFCVVASRFASSAPDGLEWAISKTTGYSEIASASGASLSGILGSIAFLLFGGLVMLALKLGRTRKTSTPDPAGH